MTIRSNILNWRSDQERSIHSPYLLSRSGLTSGGTATLPVQFFPETLYPRNFKTENSTRNNGALPTN